MSEKSQIEWTDSTWNPVTGCTKVSAGCKNCYAETFAERWRGIPKHPYEQGFDLKTWENRLEQPLFWKKPKTIFVNSMSDLFHEKIPLAFIRKVFNVMKKAHWHNFQILTKRAERLEKISSKLFWPENVWMGVSVESKDFRWRIDCLRNVPSKIRFLSIEPLLAEIGQLNLKNIDWVIVGGESGPGARYMDPEWVVNIRDQCLFEDVPFFFKQWGGVQKKKNGRTLEGEIWDEMPQILEKSKLHYA